MAGRGPPPKAPHLRRRRNKKSSSTTLDAPLDHKIPTLKPYRRKWHAATREWWREIWSSPMSTQYVAADVPGLARMAFLVDRINKDPESDKSRGLMSELRLQEARFGLSPMDRSRLDWEIGRVDPDKDPTQRPTTKKKATKKKGKPIDPRGFLKAVK